MIVSCRPQGVWGVSEKHFYKHACLLPAAHSEYAECLRKTLKHTCLLPASHREYGVCPRRRRKRRRGRGGNLLRRMCRLSTHSLLFFMTSSRLATHQYTYNNYYNYNTYNYIIMSCVALPCCLFDLACFFLPSLIKRCIILYIYDVCYMLYRPISVHQVYLPCIGLRQIYIYIYSQEPMRAEGRPIGQSCGLII